MIARACSPFSLAICGSRFSSVYRFIQCWGHPGCSGCHNRSKAEYVARNDECTHDWTSAKQYIYIYIYIYIYLFIYLFIYLYISINKFQLESPRLSHPSEFFGLTGATAKTAKNAQRWSHFPPERPPTPGVRRGCSEKCWRVCFE